MALDEAYLQEFIQRMMGEIGALATAPLILLGDRLGLYQAMVEAGPITSEELASRTHTDERYIQEWLGSQAASSFVTYDPETRRFTLPEEHALLFISSGDSPFSFASAVRELLSVFRMEERLERAFRTGGGIGWHEYEELHSCVIDQLSRTTYRTHLVSDWIPRLGEVENKLQKGTCVADLGCGLGTSTILMAQAYPNSSFFGFDFQETSIREARLRAHDAGVEDRTSFEVADAKTYPGDHYDLVTTLDALHDMGDPVGVSAHVRETLAEEGVWMIVEPYAGDHLEENLTPFGRYFYALSTMSCVPAAKAQEIGRALGSQAGEARIREVVLEAGFTRFRRMAETAVNLVFEARP